MNTVVHVHQQKAKKGDPDRHPAIIVRTYRGSTHHRHVKFDGPVTIVHEAERDACGATVVIRCDHSAIVELDPPRIF